MHSPLRLSLATLTLLSAVGCAEDAPAEQAPFGTPPTEGLVATSGASARFLPARARPIKGHYLVVLQETATRFAHERDDVGVAARPLVPERAKELTTQHQVKLTATFEPVLRGFAAQADAAGLARLLADPRVAYVEEDSLMEPAATQVGPSWGLDRIDQRSSVLDARHYHATPSPAPHLYIIDTGVRSTHVEFAGRMGTGVSFVADSWGTNDCYGHGTMVAGLAAGASKGVAKNAIIHSVRIGPCNGFAPTSANVSALAWVAANRQGFAVANLSYYQSGGDAAIDAAASALVASGVPLVAAAGNEGGDACFYSPGRVSAVITVAATTSGAGNASLARRADSNLGACVDLFAPGTDLPSAAHTSDSGVVLFNKTSAATPLVAGAIARYFADKPGFTPAAIACEAFGGTGCATPSGAATTGVVSNLSGSPDKLLYIPGLPPTITSLQCPIMSESGANTYRCSVSYTSDAPATASWPGGASGTYYTGTCLAGQRITVTVNVTNPYGSATRTSASFLCPTNPIP